MPLATLLPASVTPALTRALSPPAPTPASEPLSDILTTGESPALPGPGLDAFLSALPLWEASVTYLLRAYHMLVTVLHHTHCLNPYDNPRRLELFFLLPHFTGEKIEPQGHTMVELKPRQANLEVWVLACLPFRSNFCSMPVPFLGRLVNEQGGSLP